MYLYTLASRSPRRIELLKSMGLTFEIKSKDVEEDFSAEIPLEEVPVYLAKKKAQAFENEIIENELIISADTVVIVGNEILNKAADADEARKMLQLLSGKAHKVVTGVCIYKKNAPLHTFSETTQVYFRELSLEEIDFYIQNYQPFDKAGAYGIQEWIGLVGIHRIEGCFYNVMGLPVTTLYTNMKAWGYL